MHVIWKPTEIGRFVCLIMNGLTVTANFYFFTLVFAMTSILAPWLLNIFFFLKKSLLVTTVAGPVIIEICGQGPRHRPPCVEEALPAFCPVPLVARKQLSNFECFAV